MTTVDFITALFYEVDEQMGAIPKHPEALQAVRLGIGVGMWESHIHGEGPEE